MIDTTENPATEETTFDGEEENGVTDEYGENGGDSAESGSGPGIVDSVSEDSTNVTSIEQTPKHKGRKRSHSKMEMFEGLMSKVMKARIDGLRESYRMFIELEEKRMEMEEQQRREERQFQLQLAQVLAG